MSKLARLIIDMCVHFLFLFHTRGHHEPSTEGPKVNQQLATSPREIDEQICTTDTSAAKYLSSYRKYGCAT